MLKMPKLLQTITLILHNYRHVKIGNVNVENWYENFMLDRKLQWNDSGRRMATNWFFADDAFYLEHVLSEERITDHMLPSQLFVVKANSS